MGLEQEVKGNYYTISHGRIRRKVAEGTPGATPRELQEGDKKGTIIHELVYKSIEGVITDIKLNDGDFGVSYNFFINDMKDDYILSISENSKYTRGIVTRLPNVDLHQEVKIIPYDEFIGKNGQKVTAGINMEQNGQKVQPFYYEVDGNGKIRSANGMPSFTGDINDKDDWKMFTIQMNKFLRKEVKSRILPKLIGKVASEHKNEFPTINNKEDDFSSFIPKNQPTQEFSSKPKPQMDDDEGDDLPF